MNGFVKMMRTEETRELMRNPKTFGLLALIAIRAKWTSVFSVHNLKPGEAFIGDTDACGLTAAEYVNAKRKLEQWGLATFRATNKGTIATLTSTTVFDINANPAASRSSRMSAGIDRESDNASEPVKPAGDSIHRPTMKECVREAVDLTKAIPTPSECECLLATGEVFDLVNFYNSVSAAGILRGYEIAITEIQKLVRDKADFEDFKKAGFQSRLFDASTIRSAFVAGRHSSEEDTAEEHHE